MARVEVITGPERRRRWTDEQKQAIVAETLEPGAVVAEVRRAEVGPGQIYRWRQELRGRSDGFAQVMIAAPGNADPQAGDDPGFCAAPVIEVDFACKARLRIPASTPAALAVAVVKALARR